MSEQEQSNTWATRLCALPGVRNLIGDMPAEKAMPIVAAGLGGVVLVLFLFLVAILGMGGLLQAIGIASATYMGMMGVLHEDRLRLSKMSFVGYSAGLGLFVAIIPPVFFLALLGALSLSREELEQVGLPEKYRWILDTAGETLMIREAQG